MGQPTVFQPHPQAIAYRSRYGDLEVNGRDQLSLWLVMTPLLAVTIFSKLALPMGPTSILVAVPTLVGALLGGLLTGRFEFIPRNLAVYLVMVGVLVTEQLFTGNENSWSPSSCSPATSFRPPRWCCSPPCTPATPCRSGRARSRPASRCISSRTWPP